MKKIYLLLTPFIALAACKKDHTVAPSANPANYQLTGYGAYNIGILEDTITFVYDPDTHLLAGYREVKNASGTPRDTIQYLLTYTGKQCTSLYWTTAQTTTQLVFHYGSNYLPDTARFADATVNQGSPAYVFKYNAAGQLTDAAALAGDSVSYRLLYSYDGSGNLSELVDTIFSGAGLQPAITKFSNFDNRANPVTALRGFPTVFSTLNPLGAFSSSSTSNYRELAFTGIVEPGETSPLTGTDTYTYTYNAAGLPTQIVNGTGLVNLTYRQF